MVHYWVPGAHTCTTHRLARDITDGYHSIIIEPVEDSFSGKEQYMLNQPGVGSRAQPAEPNSVKILQEKK